MDIIERVREAIDRGEIGCGIFVDLREAFDTVSHGILLSRLEHCGITGNVLNWFESYLSSRKRYVF